MPTDRFPRLRGLQLALLTLPLLLGACATSHLTAPALPSQTPRLPEGTQITAVVSTVALPSTAAGHDTWVDKATAPPEAPADAPDIGAVKFLLAYAERLRTLSPGELTTEIAALGEPGRQPMAQMQLALALAHTHQAADTARALGLLQRVAATNNPAALAYQPLARLLAGRLLDQRRLEEALERQTQQSREQQRRIEQLTDRLEAMRAIERSLNRPGSPAPSRSRPAPTPP